MNSAAAEPLARRLERAVATGEGLSLAFQPKIRVASGAVSGVEALSRWRDDRLGPVPPGAFVPVAEATGLIEALTERVLDSAFRQWADWSEQGLKLRMAVNVSALCLRDVELPDRVQRMCMQAGMPCELLTVEVTETAAQNAVSLLDTLSRFRLKGIGVSLDDFGTGYSSLVQLRRLPFSEIKIDQCFVGDCARAPESRMIVKAVVDLAHAMGLSAIAEGVEDAATAALLRELGCDELQGYLVSPPIRGAALVDWLLHCGWGLEGREHDRAASRPWPPAPAAQASEEAA